MTTFITAFLLIFLAEMGDKTQLLALAFSTKYKVRQVLMGVFFGAFLNHGIAIALASFVSGLASATTIKIFASTLFILFGLWSMKLEFEDDEEENQKFNFGPMITVAFAFFLGELGDKTQMTAMTLGLESVNPFITLLGTTAGMVGVSAIGIIVGKLIGKKIPETTMKFVSAFVFMGFGLVGLKSAVPISIATPLNISIFAILIIASILVILKTNSKNRNKYFAQKFNYAIENCKECDIHNKACKIGKEIEEIQKEFTGTGIPYLGKIVTYMESIEKVSPQKYKSLKN